MTTFFFFVNKSHAHNTAADECTRWISKRKRFPRKPINDDRQLKTFDRSFTFVFTLSFKIFHVNGFFSTKFNSFSRSSRQFHAIIWPPIIYRDRLSCRPSTLEFFVKHAFTLGTVIWSAVSRSVRSSGSSNLIRFWGRIRFSWIDRHKKRTLKSALN